MSEHLKLSVKSTPGDADCLTAVCGDCGVHMLVYGIDWDRTELVPSIASLIRVTLNAVRECSR